MKINYKNFWTLWTVFIFLVLAVVLFVFIKQDRPKEVISGGYEMATGTVATSTGFFEALPTDLNGK